MRVAVTGATGNVGTALVDALTDDGRIEEVVGIARRTPSPDVAAASPRVRYVAADVAHDDLRPLFADVDAVVHLAWKIQPSHRPLETWHTNVIGSEHVFRACADVGVDALVHASSIGAYSPGPADGRPVDESWPTHSMPTAGYGREKAYVERLLDVVESERPGMRVVRMRPAFTFQRSASSQQRRLFIGSWLPGPVLGRLPVAPMPSGLKVQAVHAIDAADAYRRAVLGDVRGPFNIAASPVLSGDDVAAILGARCITVPRRVVRAVLTSGWRTHLVPSEPPLFDLFMRLPVMDCTRAHDELAWVPERSSASALRDVFEGMRDGAHGSTPPLGPH
jgi:UDP-glucose 4-epimerase